MPRRAAPKSTVLSTISTRHDGDGDVSMDSLKSALRTNASSRSTSRRARFNEPTPPPRSNPRGHKRSHGSVMDTDEPSIDHAAVKPALFIDSSSVKDTEMSAAYSEPHARASISSISEPCLLPHLLTWSVFAETTLGSRMRTNESLSASKINQAVAEELYRHEISLKDVQMDAFVAASFPDQSKAFKSTPDSTLVTPYLEACENYATALLNIKDNDASDEQVRTFIAIVNSVATASWSPCRAIVGRDWARLYGEASEHKVVGNRRCARRSTLWFATRTSFDACYSTDLTPP